MYHFALIYRKGKIWTMNRTFTTFDEAMVQILCISIVSVQEKDGNQLKFKRADRGHALPSIVTHTASRILY